MQVDCTISGLTFNGSYDYEAPTGPTYACGGTPGGTDVEVWDVEVDDPADPGDFLADVADYIGTGAARVAEGYIRVMGILPPTLKAWALSHYEEEAIEALAEAGATWEPDYDEDARYDWD